MVEGIIWNNYYQTDNIIKNRITIFTFKWQKKFGANFLNDLFEDYFL